MRIGLCEYACGALMVGAMAAPAIGQEVPTPLAQYDIQQAGHVTMGVVLPQGWAPSALQLGGSPTQTDVKTTWPDGSIRFAVVSASVPHSGPAPLTRAASGAPGSFVPGWPTATVELDLNGATYFARFAPPTSDFWLKGPVVVEGRTMSTFAGAPAPASELRVIWDVRVYATGASRVDVTVQNARNTSAAGAVFGGYRVIVNGAVRDTWTYRISAGPSTLSQPQGNHVVTSVGHRLVVNDYIRLADGMTRRVREVINSDQVRITSPFSGQQTATTWQKVTFYQPYLTRWRRTYWSGAVGEAQLTPDFTPFYRAGAIPAYLSTVFGPSRSTSGPAFDILTIGDQSYPMDTVGAGGREDVGPYPRWVAQYMVHRRQDQRDYVLRNGDVAAGAWAAHVTGPDDKLLRLDDYPNYNMVKSGGGTLPLANSLTALHYTPEAGAAHEPSLAYVPYLLTGDRFFLDEMKFWANRAMLSWLGGRNGAAGLLTGQQLRGIAWGLRNLVDAVAYCPDKDADKPYFATKLANNLTELDRLERLEGDPLGSTELGYGTENISAFQLSFFAWSLEHARNQGFDSTGQRYLQRVVGWFVRLFGPGSGFNRENIAFYTLAVRRPDKTFFTSYRELWDGNFGPAGVNPTTKPPPWVGSYGVNVAMLMGIAVRLEMPSASSYYAYTIFKNEGGYTVLNDLNNRSAYALSTQKLDGSGVLTPTGLRVVR